MSDFNKFKLSSKSFISNYEKICNIGNGAFGKVYKARELQTGNIVAVKQLKIYNSRTNYQNIIKEINLLKHLSHPNIVKYYNYFEEDDKIFIIMEYLEGGTLKEYINNNQNNITEDNARIIIKQLLNALSYLHYSCDICHRDIKPENILFKYKDDINSLQLVDFGLSADTFEEKNYLNNCGTLKYMAPEQIANMIYSKAVDVWSVGIILYMLLNNGNNPFCNSNDSKEVIINNIKNKNIEFGENFFISEMGKNLIKKILKKNPSYRYTARLALFHPWITLNKFDQIPLTMYDKILVDECVDNLKILFLSSIFFFSYKKNIDNSLINSKKRRDSDSTIISNNSLRNNDDKKKIIEINKNKFLNLNQNNFNNKIMKINNFNMDEYEQRVIETNLILENRYKEYRENLFIPKINNEKNILLDSIKNNIKFLKPKNKVNSQIINDNEIDIKNYFKINSNNNRNNILNDEISPNKKNNTHNYFEQKNLNIFLKKEKTFNDFTSNENDLNCLEPLNIDKKIQKPKDVQNNYKKISNLILNQSNSDKTNNFNSNINSNSKFDKFKLLFQTKDIKKDMDKKSSNVLLSNIINKNNNYNIYANQKSSNSSNTINNNNKHCKKIINIENNLPNHININKKIRNFSNNKRDRIYNVDEAKKNFNLVGTQIINNQKDKNRNNSDNFKYFTYAKRNSNLNINNIFNNEYMKYDKIYNNNYNSNQTNTTSKNINYPQLSNTKIIDSSGINYMNNLEMIKPIKLFQHKNPSRILPKIEK